MKVTDESSDFSPDTAYSERQVMLYPAAWEDPSPGMMEEIKISIVNDRATGLKRQREEELTAVTPCSKKLCSDVFSCSTPSSASLPSWSSPSTSKSKGVKWSHVSFPSYTMDQNPEFSDEWDESLLEPSDNEDNSPLYLTVDEIESLLEDDSCFEADPSGFDTCIVASKSEDDNGKSCTSPSQLHISNTLTEATLCEEDLNNYATMAPSPSRSIVHPVEDQVSKQENHIVGNVNSDSVKAINEMSTSAVPVLDKTEALTQLASDYSDNFPVLSPNSLYTMDVLLEWNDDPELAFDGDIDNLLAISPGGSTSSEEETAIEPYIQCTEQIGSAVSDSTSTFKLPDSVPVNQTADSAGSDTADVVQRSYTADAVQQLSPSSPYTLDQSEALEVHCPPSTVPELPEDSGSPSTSTVVISETQTSTVVISETQTSTVVISETQTSTVVISETQTSTVVISETQTSTVVISETQRNTDAAEDVIPSTSTESDAISTVGLNDQPVISSAAQSASSQQTVCNTLLSAKFVST